MSGQFLFGFGDIVNSVSNAFSGIANWLSDKMGGWLEFFITALLKFAYRILEVFFMLLDFIQLVFRKMAGLDTVYIAGGDPDGESGDLALMLFRNENVVNALIALGMVAIVLLFMTTFVTIIRNHYRAKESKDVAIGPVIGKAFKAIFSFIFVPVVCYFGVYISNGLLKTVDNATRMSGALTVSGEIFAASAMNANRARIDADFATKLANDTNLNYNGYFIDDQNLQYSTSKSAADKIDKAFASKMSSPDANIVASENDYSFMFHQASPGEIDNFDYMDVNLVHVYYDLQEFNWLFAFVSCFFITATLLVAALGIIQRLYEITILFAISPPFIALMPMDDGKAFGNWTKKFVGSTLIMYGTVVALNFFFIIAPVLQSINLFGSPAEIATYGKLTCDLFNSIAHVLFIMCGSLVIKDFTNLINELVAGEKVKGLDERGGNIAKEVQGNMAKGLKTIDATAGAAKRKLDDRFDPENVKKRQEAKAEKKTAKEAKAGRNANVNAMRKSGEIGRLQARAMKHDLNREAKGKTGTLLGRSEKFQDLKEKAKDTQRFSENLAEHQGKAARTSRLLHPLATSQGGVRRSARRETTKEKYDQSMGGMLKSMQKVSKRNIKNAGKAAYKQAREDGKSRWTASDEKWKAKTKAKKDEFGLNAMESVTLHNRKQVKGLYGKTSTTEIGEKASNKASKVKQKVKNKVLGNNNNNNNP